MRESESGGRPSREINGLRELNRVTSVNATAICLSRRRIIGPLTPSKSASEGGYHEKGKGFKYRVCVRVRFRGKGLRVKGERLRVKG